MTPTPQGSQDEHSGNLLSTVFPLDDGTLLHLALPEDLTAREADRLGATLNIRKAVQMLKDAPVPTEGRIDLASLPKATPEQDAK